MNSTSSRRRFLNRLISSGQVSVFRLNRDLDSARQLTLDWGGPAPARVLACETLTGPDLKAFNTFEKPAVVSPQTLEAPRPGERMTFKLPPRSYSVCQFATA